MKRAMKRLARPFTRRAQARLNRSVKGQVTQSVKVQTKSLGTRLDLVEQRVGQGSGFVPNFRKVQRDVDSLNKYVPTIVNTISSQHAALRAMRRAEIAFEGSIERIDRAEAQIKYLEERMEFIRTETLFEMKYGSKADAEVATGPRIINERKLKESERIRLNLGCGHIPKDDYLNVDMRAIEGVDIVASLDALPFESGEVHAMYSSHVLEHFPVEALRRTLLPYWFSLLAPGGEFRAVVPDALSMIKHFNDGSVSFANLRLVTYGGQEYEGDFHHNMFSPESMTELLEEIGFSDVIIADSDRVNGASYEMEVVATKPRTPA